MAIQLISQICMRGSLKHLWSFYYAMQQCTYVNIIGFGLSRSAEIFNTQFVKLIEFDILNPEGLIKLVNPDFDMNRYLQGLNPEDPNPEWPSLVNQMIVYLVLIGIVMLIMTVLSLVMLIPRLKEFATRTMTDLRQKFVWNGLIRIFLQGWLKFLVVLVIQSKAWINNSQDFPLAYKLAVCIWFALMVLIDFLLFRFLFKRADLLTQKKYVGSDEHMDFE